jgi:catechol 2,3-dioxygenase-like lactoylglutathione lyase family enzyme
MVHIARVGNGVTDLDLVRPFYEALGFEASPPFDLGTKIADQSETPGSPLVIQIVRRDGFDLELVQHGGQRPPGRPPTRRPMNLLGLTHLAIAVDDVAAAEAALTALGGTVHDGSRHGDAVFCSDPCGTRVLLLGPAAPIRRADRGVDHLGICVTDLDRTVPFWRTLGFEVGERAHLGTTWSAAAELDDLPLTVQRLGQGAYPLLLLQWGAARDAGFPVRLPLNRVGELLHFGTHVEDFDATLAALEQRGGTVVRRTMGRFPPPGIEVPGMAEPHGWVFVLDPNGVQVEVVGPRRPGTVSGPEGR